MYYAQVSALHHFIAALPGIIVEFLGHVASHWTPESFGRNSRSTK